MGGRASVAYTERIVVEEVRRWQWIPDAEVQVVNTRYHFRDDAHIPHLLQILSNRNPR